ncbi:uncharacterized protein CMU_037670 [Cryptosporidium muris RN66]|uniref:WD domain, G-beta repeat-containing protein n=1 Tax=Cryptosporidium muris (strain RN66) TaxID=441375 RepID=B6A911_CRYMR|nr:uncharacterized protein CMU_037670 [Cryptosporidium muris RN66]EEA04702.1 hypothetical protein, conserved [Cryptosporidium muris RN66]|eukprot:XP_002139051.1 hypothetical protein [Cryptosporidium muris RN66]
MNKPEALNNSQFSGGCFSLRIKPVFCLDGKYLAIPKGRDKTVFIYETLGDGSIISKLVGAKMPISGVVSLHLNPEIIIISSLDGKCRLYKFIENELTINPIFEFEINDNNSIIDMKTTDKDIFFLTTSAESICEIPLNTNFVSIFSISIEDILKLTSNNEIDTENIGRSIKPREVIKFSYGASSFEVSKDGNLFCFIWRNILILWTPIYSDKIVRFRHSEYLISMDICYNCQFVVTGDVYGRLTYWFLPPIDYKNENSIWNEASNIDEERYDKMLMNNSINTSTSHWHSHELRAISMIPESDVVLSGGEEAVLVLWRQTFASDTFRKKESLSPQQNGTRQFLPRLGAPIYTISVFSSCYNKKVFKMGAIIPNLTAAITCADNCIRIVDLVHMKIINSIRGIAIPYNLVVSPNIKLECNKLTNDNYKCNTSSMKLSNYSGYSSGLPVAIIGHPFKVHIHDAYKDKSIASILTKYEESYVSSIGEGLSAPKYNDVLNKHCFLSMVTFSDCGRYSVTSECHKYGILKNKKSRYNLKFWEKIESEDIISYKIMTEIVDAHLDTVVALFQCSSSNYSYECKHPIFLTASKDKYIKLWVYNNEVNEWYCAQVISCYEKYIFTSNIYLETGIVAVTVPNLIVLYSFNNENMSLNEVKAIPVPKYQGMAISEQQIVLSQIEIVKKSDSIFLISVISSELLSKLLIWNLDTYVLVWEGKFNSSSFIVNGKNLLGNFTFAIIDRDPKTTINLYDIDLDPFNLINIASLELEIPEDNWISDALICHRLKTSQCYIVILLSSADIYIKLLGCLDNKLEDESLDSTMGTIKDVEREVTFEDLHNLDIIKQIEELYISSGFEKQLINDTKISKSQENPLSSISNKIKELISSCDNKDDTLSNFSTLYCSKFDKAQQFGNTKMKNLSRGLNTYLCPLPSSLLQSMINCPLHNTQETGVVEVIQTRDHKKQNNSSFGISSKSNYEPLKPLQSHKLQSIIRKYSDKDITMDKKKTIEAYSHNKSKKKKKIAAFDTQEVA